MTTWTRRVITLALMAAVGFAMGCYIAHNDPDTLTVVGAGAAMGTASFFLSWWAVRAKPVLNDTPGD